MDIAALYFIKRLPIGFITQKQKRSYRQRIITLFFPKLKEEIPNRLPEGEYEMKSEKKETNKKKVESTTSENNYDIDIQTCSTMDCTGLIPAAPQSEAELEAYEDLYPYMPHAKNVEKD